MMIFQKRLTGTATTIITFTFTCIITGKLTKYVALCVHKLHCVLT